MRHSSISRFAFIATILSTVPAFAASSGDSGLEIGFRTGYAFSAGHLGAVAGDIDRDLGSYVSGQWPFWLDLGYRINSSWYVGGFFQYGVGFVNDDQQSGCRNADVDCSASDLRVGIMGRYHFGLVARTLPWVGYGIGWERAKFSMRGTSVDTDGDLVWSGMEFANFQLGVDFALPHRSTIAPFISVSLGEFDNQTTTWRLISTSQTRDQSLAKQSLHEWIFIGVRVAIAP
jgi:opacity protein-like surface antigen